MYLCIKTGFFVFGLFVICCGGGTVPVVNHEVPMVFRDITSAENLLPDFLKPDPLAPKDGLTRVFLGDLDGDGRPEVVMSRTVGSVRGSAAFRYDREAQHLVAYGPMPFPGVVVATQDLTGDGLTDFVTQDGVVHVQHADGGFVGNVLGINEILTITTGDFDRDGRQDLMVGISCDNQSCTDIFVFIQPRSGVFEQIPHAIEKSYGSRYPYDMLFVEGVDAGKDFLVVCGREWGTNDLPPVFFEKEIRDGRVYFRAINPLPKDDFWPRLAGLGDGYPLNLVFAAASPMGAAVGRGVQGNRMLAIALKQGVAVFTMNDDGWEEITEHVGAYFQTSSTGKRMIPWSVAFQDVDHDGLDDLIVTHGTDGQALGEQRVTIHRQQTDGSFHEVEDIGDLSRLGQWRSLVVGDLNGDGFADVLVGGAGEHPRVYLRVDP